MIHEYRNRSSAGLLSLTTLALTTIVAGGARAQQVDASSTLEEIVVTAQKREQSINDVGMSISAVSGEALQARGIKSAADLVKVVPGFSYTPTQFDMPVYTLRGVGYYESSLAANPAVSVYVDEVPLPYPAMVRGALLDLQRVEVLMGPQGTLFGQNATGGAINYIANKPTGAFEAGVTVDYGRFNTYGVEGYVSGPLTERISARLALSSVQGDGWQKSIDRGDEIGRTDELMGRLLVDFNPSDTLSFRFNANGWRDRSDSQAPQHRGISIAVPGVPLDPAFIAAPLAPDYARATNFDPGFDYSRDTTFYQTALRGDWSPNDDLTLTSISSWQHTDREQFAETDGTSVQDLALGTGGEISSFSQELRLAGSGDGRVRHWVVGANYQDDEIVDNQDVLLEVGTSSFVALGPFGLFHYPGVDNISSSDVRTWAVFASVELALTDRLALELGGRYTDARNEFAGCSADDGTGQLTAAFSALQALGAFLGANPTVAPVPGGCVTIVDANFNVGETRETLSEDNAPWRANLNWRATDDLLLYANVSRGYKAGNFPTLSASNASQFTPVTQEQLTAYETGLKLTLPIARMQLNSAAFYYDYVDKQLRGRVSDPLFGQLEALVNVPSSHVWGAELQWTWEPVGGFTGNLGVTYIQTQIDGTFENFSQFGGPPQSFSGNEFPYSPNWQGNADIGYRHTLTGALVGFVGAALTYRSETKGGLENDTRLAIDSYTLLDLRAGLESETGSWRVMAWGRNLTDEYYWNNVLKAQDNVIRYAGRPLTYGVTFSSRF
jgi:iron complex outermembrane receptor protein